MTRPSVQPRPCTDSNCRGKHGPAERVALAMSLCGARGAQLTTLRRQILELLWESGRRLSRCQLHVRDLSDNATEIARPHQSSTNPYHVLYVKVQ